LFALLWIAPQLAHRSAFAPWLLSPAIGLFLYRITIVMHDCTHHTLFESRRLNRVIGVLLGALSGVDFNSFCHQHWRHHRSYGRDGDPQGFQYLGLRRMTPIQRRWHLAKPLLGLNLRYVIVESVFAPRNLVRLIRTGEFKVLALVQFAVLAIVTGFGAYPYLAALPFLSAATFGLFFSQLRGIAEHGDVGEADIHVVRSHAPSWLDRIFLYDLNFNYHAEHHAHPQIPSCHLPAVHKAAVTSETSASMFETLSGVCVGSGASHV
jgi:fatty acid desaturase